MGRKRRIKRGEDLKGGRVKGRGRDGGGGGVEGVGGIREGQEKE